MYAPHTITVYNIVRETDQDTMEDMVTNYLTILRGVMLQASKAVNVRRTGLESADVVDLYIPFTTPAVGADGADKRFATPLEFAAASDKTGIWTLSANGKGCTTLFVKGEVIEPRMTAQQLEAAYDGCYKVTKVDELDYGGSEMMHWHVGGA